MYLKVQIPARFTLLTSDTDPTPVEMGVIGNSSNQFTIMGLDSLNAPWVQYDKNNDHVYRPDYFSNTLPLFRGDSKRRPNKFPDTLSIFKQNLTQLLPKNQHFAAGSEPYYSFYETELPSNFMDNALVVQDFQHQNINDLLDNYLGVRLRGIEPFMDWVGRQDDVFGFVNSGTLQKNNPQLTEDRGGSASLILTHLDTSDQAEARKTTIFTPVNHSSNPATYGYISTNLHGYDCKFQQRMTADAPYNSSTAKFSPNQTYPISMLYRYRSTIQEDAANLRTKEAVKGRRYYGSPTANFTPPLLDWSSIGYPRLSLTKSQSELRRKPIQITFNKNTVKFLSETLSETSEQDFKSSVFSLEKMFHMEPAQVFNYTNHLVSSNTNLTSTKCYILTDYRRRYYHDPDTPIAEEDDPLKDDAKDPKLKEIPSPPNVETYGYSQSGFGYSLRVNQKMEQQLSRYGTVINHEKTSKKNNQPKAAVKAWETMNSRQYNNLWLAPNAQGEIKVTEFSQDGSELLKEDAERKYLPLTSVESGLNRTGGKQINLDFDPAKGGLFPTADSPHWELWKDQVKKIKEVTFRSENFFDIFNYTTCFYNNKTSLKNNPSKGELYNFMESIENTLGQFLNYRPNREIKKWAKANNIENPPLYALKITDETVKENGLSMKAVRITYTVPYFSRLGGEGYNTTFTDVNEYPNFATDLQGIRFTGTATQDSLLILHPDGLGVSLHQKSQILPLVTLINSQVLRIQGLYPDMNMSMSVFTDFGNYTANQSAGWLGLSAKMIEIPELIPLDSRFYYDIERYFTAGTMAYNLLQGQAQTTGTTGAYTEMDAVLTAWDFIRQEGLDQLYRVRTRHIRSGFTVSDPMAFPISFKRGKVTTNATLRYTYPFPWVSMNNYVTQSEEPYLPVETYPSFLYNSLKEFDLPSTGTLDMTKVISTEGGNHDTNHGGKVSLFTQATYDPKQEASLIPKDSGSRFVKDPTERSEIINDINNLTPNRYKNSSLNLNSGGVKLAEEVNIVYRNRKSDTDGKGSNSPTFEFRQQKVGSRMLKYAKDQGGYTNGRRPQDYVIFADLILPFAPRHLDIFELSEESGGEFLQT